MMTVRSDQWRGSLKPSTLVGCSTSSLSHDSGRVLLLAVLVVGHQEREQIVSDAPVDGSMLVTGSGQTPEVIDTDPGVRRIFSGSRFHSSVRPRDREKLLRVRPRSLPELAREAGQPALVLHVQKKLRRAVRVGGDDHLLGGVGVMVEMRGSLRPTGMTRVHLEPASSSGTRSYTSCSSWISTPSFSAR